MLAHMVMEFGHFLKKRGKSFLQERKERALEKIEKQNKTIMI